MSGDLTCRDRIMSGYVSRKGKSDRKKNLRQEQISTTRIDRLFNLIFHDSVSLLLIRIVDRFVLVFQQYRPPSIGSSQFLLLSYRLFSGIHGDFLVSFLGWVKASSFFLPYRSVLHSFYLGKSNKCLV
jgi:hypothetical protein